ncbi:hypothetical protein [Streptomyces sp. NPDC046976]|uniref:hypothetical protein n=1 Tax=Streptomyces sp. NPDC046976 TaxID=3155258 RepID=UPI00340C3EE5
MAHHLKFNPAIAEGAAIVWLFNEIREHVEDDEGGWNGADTVDAPCGWFRGLGIDTEKSSGLIET